MAGSSQQYVWQLGATQITVGASLAMQIIPPRTTVDITFKMLTGTSLAIVNGATTQLGYPLSSTEVFKILGPANFSVSAAGSTQIAAVVFGLGSGFSMLP